MAAVRAGLERSLFAVVVAVWAATPAGAITITDQVGTPATNCDTLGCDGVENTLTGMLPAQVNGFIELFDFSIEFDYGAIATQILSAFIEIDLIDADAGILNLFAGSDNTGPLIGSATGLDQGLPGPFRELGVAPPTGSVDNVVPIAASLFPDLADGTFQVFFEDTIGGTEGLTFWGSNRAKLTIETMNFIPEPTTAALAMTGLCMLAVVGRRRWI